MAKIKIHRPKQFADLWRKYKVLLDGNEAATIGAGETIEVLIPAGVEELQCQIDWCYSNTIRCAAAIQAKSITVMHTKHRSFWERLIALGRATIGKDSYLTILLGTQKP